MQGIRQVLKGIRDRLLWADTYTSSGLSGITDIYTYLDCLGTDAVKKNTLVVVSVKDTVGMAVTGKLSGKIKEMLGCRADLQGKHWKGYLAVINRGKVLEERLSVKDESVECVLKAEGIKISVFSSAYCRENVSQILLDGTDYSRNSRGLNIVVYDWSIMQVRDAVCFDTHAAGIPCTRERIEEHSLDIRHSAAYLERRMDELSDRIRSLEDSVKCNARKEQMVLWQVYERAYGSRREAEKAFFLALPQATGVMRKFQKVGIILLENFDRICRAHGIVYWLGFGTLLGAVRHKGFIPWDDDTDVCMTRDQAEKLSAAMEKEEAFYFDEYIFTDIGNTNLCRQFRVRGLDISLDIFVYDYCNDVSKENVEKQYCLKHEMSQKGWDIYCRMQNMPKQREEELRRLIEEYKIKAHEETGLLEGTDGKALMWAVDNVDAGVAKGSCVELDKIFPLELIEFEGHQYFSPKNPQNYLMKIYEDIYTLPDDLVSHTHFDGIKEDQEIDRILNVYREHGLQYERK